MIHGRIVIESAELRNRQGKKAGKLGCRVHGNEKVHIFSHINVSLGARASPGQLVLVWERELKSFRVKYCIEGCMQLFLPGLAL